MVVVLRQFGPLTKIRRVFTGKEPWLGLKFTLLVEYGFGLDLVSISQHYFTDKAVMLLPVLLMQILLLLSLGLC